MKRIVLIALALLVATALMAERMHQNRMADCDGCNQHEGMRMGRGEQQPERFGMLHVFQELELTEAQMAKLEELRISHEKQRITLMAEIETREIDERVAMHAFNFAEAKKINADIFKLKADLKGKSLDHMATCWKELTDEQKAQAQQLMRQPKRERKNEMPCKDDEKMMMKHHGKK